MPTSETPTAVSLAQWAAALTPTPSDLDLAQTALVDTVAVAVAAADHPLMRVIADLPAAARWAAQAHVLDFDDLHLSSTTHINAVCVPAAIAVDGDARTYLSGAGVMARLGMALGWNHYSRGWHATSTSGPVAAAVVAAIALGLDVDQMAMAMALSVSNCGGVQRSFGSDAKSIQVGLAVEAGIRAARLVAAGATADVRALDSWLHLVSGPPFVDAIDESAAIPGGLAVKTYPCCYALQRPIACAGEVAKYLDPDQVVRINIWLTESAVQPLVHHRPSTGLEAKFSLEHALAVAVADEIPGFASFTDAAVRRPEIHRLTRSVTAHVTAGGPGLLDDTVRIEVVTTDGQSHVGEMGVPPGAPARPLTAQQIAHKVRDCAGDRADDVLSIDWDHPRGAAALFGGEVCR